ncbi:MAG: hypothetical protein ACKVHE_17270 [Planctomycetales bacterium]
MRTFDSESGVRPRRLRSHGVQAGLAVFALVGSEFAVKKLVSLLKAILSPEPFELRAPD